MVGVLLPQRNKTFCVLSTRPGFQLSRSRLAATVRRWLMVTEILTGTI
jgi:hypothetical protein